MKRLILAFIALLVVLLTTSVPVNAYARGWSWNIGYHNPPGATVGLNFLYQWTNFAFEAGVGSIDSKNNNSSSTTGGENKSNTVTVGGDINLKYLFGSGWLRPYLQGGVMTGVAADNDSAGAGTGSGFWGGGLFLQGNPFYFYLGANVLRSNTDGFAGLGFDF